MTTISAVLIAKDERDTVGRCVRSLKGIEQIVVLDTGSSDGTPFMAQKEGAEVHVGTKRDPFHFADARNEALSHATGDWILSIDADETLRPGSVGAIRDAVRVGGYEGFRVLHLDRRPGSTVEVSDRKLRLFKRGRLKWKYRIHELLEPEGAPAKIGKLDDCSMEHLPPPGRDKSYRNLELLRLCVKESPEHHGALMKLGQELLLAGEIGEGIYRLQEYTEKEGPAPDFKSEAFCQIGRAIAKQNRLEDALDVFEKAHQAAPLRREPLWYAALELMKAAKIPAAKGFLKACISIPKTAKSEFHLNLPEVWDKLPIEALAWCEAELRKAEETWKRQKA